jgi:hypothetical protein
MIARTHVAAIVARGSLIRRGSPLARSLTSLGQLIGSRSAAALTERAA